MLSRMEKRCHAPRLSGPAGARTRCTQPRSGRCVPDRVACVLYLAMDMARCKMVAAVPCGGDAVGLPASEAALTQAVSPLKMRGIKLRKLQAAFTTLRSPSAIDAAANGIRSTRASASSGEGVVSHQTSVPVLVSTRYGLSESQMPTSLPT